MSSSLPRDVWPFPMPWSFGSPRGPPCTSPPHEAPLGRGKLLNVAEMAPGPRQLAHQQGPAVPQRCTWLQGPDGLEATPLAPAHEYASL